MNAKSRNSPKYTLPYSRSKRKNAPKNRFQSAATTLWREQKNATKQTSGHTQDYAMTTQAHTHRGLCSAHQSVKSMFLTAKQLHRQQRRQLQELPSSRALHGRAQMGSAAKKLALARQARSGTATPMDTVMQDAATAIVKSKAFQ